MRLNGWCPFVFCDRIRIPKSESSEVFTYMNCFFIYGRETTLNFYCSLCILWCICNIFEQRQHTHRIVNIYRCMHCTQRIILFNEIRIKCKEGTAKGLKCRLKKKQKQCAEENNESSWIRLGIYRIKHAAAAEVSPPSQAITMAMAIVSNAIKQKQNQKQNSKNNGKRESTACKNYIKIWILFVVATFAFL